MSDSLVEGSLEWWKHEAETFKYERDSLRDRLSTMTKELNESNRQVEANRKSDESFVRSVNALANEQKTVAPMPKSDDDYMLLKLKHDLAEMTRLVNTVTSLEYNRTRERNIARAELAVERTITKSACDEAKTLKIELSTAQEEIKRVKHDLALETAIVTGLRNELALEQQCYAALDKHAEVLREGFSKALSNISNVFNNPGDVLLSTVFGERRWYLMHNAFVAKCLTFVSEWKSRLLVRPPSASDLKQAREKCAEPETAAAIKRLSEENK